MSSGEDWDASDYEGGAPAATAGASASKTNGASAATIAAKSKYADEDADDAGDVKVKHSYSEYW